LKSQSKEKVLGAIAVAFREEEKKNRAEARESVLGAHFRGGNASEASVKRLPRPSRVYQKSGAVGPP